MCRKSIYLAVSFLMLGVVSIARADLVGYWSLDEGSGTTVHDSSGNGNDGFIVNNPTWIPGILGTALEFHGLGIAGGGGDYIYCGNDASLDITSQISIALWIRPDADDPERKGTETAPMAKAMRGMSPDWSWQVRYGWGPGAPQRYMAFTFNTSPRAWAFVDKNLERYEWYHIACSYDGMTLKCYLNGEQTDSTPMGEIIRSSTPLLIGSDGWGSDWIGAIDDVRLYNHALSEPEILNAMEGGIRPYAWDPEPQDGALYPDTRVTLSWRPDVFAVSHDIYFGEHFDDVNDGIAGTFQGNQTATSFNVGLPGGPYPDGLVLDTTYYWRIDEVEADGTTIHKGNVWSFTVVEAVTVEYQVSSSEDDGYAFNEEGQNVDFAYLRVGSSAFAQPPYYTSGMVFRHVNIPQGAEIISAYLKIRSYDSRLTDNVYGKIEGEAVDDAMALGGSRHIGSLPRTAASVDWDLDEPWSANTLYDSPDIAEVIQEVIDRDGWIANNSLVILYGTRQSGGGYRNFCSYDCGNDGAPKLEVTYRPY